MNFKNLPLLHTHLPDHAGTFCGIVGGTPEQPYAALVLLDAKPATKLNWADACAWGQSLGDGCNVTSRELMDKSDWHWTNTEYTPFSDSDAWMQNFRNGSQPNDFQSSGRLCRAVRLIQLSA